VGRRWIAVAAGLLAAGCAYNTTGRSAANVGNVYIPFFQDETSGERAPDLGVRLTEMVVLEFMRDKDIRVYQGERERELADKELLGTVRRLTEAVLTRSAEETQEEYRVLVVCSIQYKDVGSSEVRWQDQGLSGDGNYLIEEGDPGFERALEEALREIVDKILDKTVRAW
jgi:hypothetical protein